MAPMLCLGSLSLCTDRRTGPFGDRRNVSKTLTDSDLSLLIKDFLTKPILLSQDHEASPSSGQDLWPERWFKERRYAAIPGVVSRPVRAQQGAESQAQREERSQGLGAWDRADL